MKISLGTWQIAPSDGFWTTQNRTASESVVTTAVRLGIRHFDTAQSYGKGQSEQVLSKVLSRYSSQQFSVDTKIMPSTKAVADILKVSQMRLKAVPIDCLYLHWPRSGFDNRSFLAQMAELKDFGAVQKIGVCNMPLSDLESMISNGLQIDRFQRPLSLLWTRELKETQDFCIAHNIEFVVYSPMGMGLLSGKYRQSTDLSDARSESFCFDPRCHKQYLNLLDEIAAVATANAVSMPDVALAWTASQNPGILLLGARDSKQLESDLRAVKLVLPQPDLDRLTQAAKELEKASLGVCDNIFSYNW
ncbi:MAG: aldo/keto reductase [Sphaerochaetaceae bacterium]|nr:aldo/keto reductase [Sphaerochaetaceae bacterium]